jgi:hypothetical protein
MLRTVFTLIVRIERFPALGRMRPTGAARVGDELHAALLAVLGDCRPCLMPDKPATETKPITLGEFAEWWLTHIAERERRNYWTEGDILRSEHHPADPRQADAARRNHDGEGEEAPRRVPPSPRAAGGSYRPLRRRAASCRPTDHAHTRRCAARGTHGGAG